MFKVKRRATALLLAALMATSGPGVVGLAADFSANGSAKDSAVWQVGDTQVKGFLRGAPAEANLEEEGPLGWIHFSDKTLENCPPEERGQWNHGHRAVRYNGTDRWGHGDQFPL